MSIPFLPIHPHPHPQRLMSKTYRRRLRRQQAGVRAPQGGPDFVSPEDQFRMSLDKEQVECLAVALLLRRSLRLGKALHAQQ